MNLRFKNEHDIYPVLIKQLLSQDFLAFIIKDGSFGKKPYDIQCVTPDGKAMSIEVKFLKEELFPNYSEKCHLGLYRTHQLNYTSEVTRRGGLGFLLEVYEKKFELGSDVKENRRANLFLYQKDKESVIIPAWIEGIDWKNIARMIEEFRK
jgi:hypothetical protein